MKPKVKAIYTLYRHGKLTKAQVHASVPEVLTAEEYKTITGEEFMAYVNADSKRLTDGSEAEEPPEQTEAPSESE